MSAPAFAECGLRIVRRDGNPCDGADDATDAPAGVSHASTAVLRAIALGRAADLDLSPIIGRQGALAVLRRAMALNRTTFDWLPATEDILEFGEVDARLREAFALQRPGEGDAAASALSTTLHDLLSSLVGAGLAQQLLRTVRAPRIDAAIERPRPT